MTATKTAHSPAPWTMERRQHVIAIHSSEPPTEGFDALTGRPVKSPPAPVCRVSNGPGCPHGEANARLILAAPKLLAALRETRWLLVTVCGVPDKGKGWTPEQQAALDLGREALAEAENR